MTHPRDYDDAFRAEEKKESKEDRKRAIKKDRSKYKKTDFEKFQEELQKEYKEKASQLNLKSGQVTSIRSEGINVASEGKTWVCTLRGLLKKTKTQYKNLVAVGDIVHFEPLNDEEGVIAYMDPRSSVLARADTLSQKKQQIIAANVDQLLVTASVVSPTLKPSLVDRYLIAADKGNLHAVIVINKIDLLEGEDPFLDEFKRAHEAVGTQVVLASTVLEKGLDELKSVMKDKVSVFSGQSGVGKSSLINAVTGMNLPVREIVERTQKGAHTTTRARMLPLSFGGYVVDTPGIQSFGVWDLELWELESYFPEFVKYREGCKFSTCTHLHEPGCAVKEALENEELSPIRYESYANLAEQIQQEHFRR